MTTGMITAATTRASATLPETDSSVLSGLWSLTVTFANSTATWSRLDQAPLIVTAGSRGEPRIVDASAGLQLNPGGRVFHAMNVASNGDLFLYGGRGHAAGYWVDPESALAPTVPLGALPRPSPFTIPLSGFYTSPGDSAAVTYHAFIYTYAELSAAGVPTSLNLATLEFMFALHHSADISLAGTFDASSSFKVRMLAVTTTLSTFDSSDSTVFSNLAARVSQQPAVTVYPSTWLQGTFMSLTAPYARASSGATGEAPLLSSSNMLIVMRIDHTMVGTPAASSTPLYGLALREGTLLRSMSIVADAVTTLTSPYNTFEKYTARPVLGLRSPLPSHPFTAPPASLSQAASPQLDDLWRFARESGTWQLLRGYMTPVSRNSAA